MTVVAGPDLEQRFREITDGWMLVDDFDDLTDRIEKLGDLAKEAGGLAWMTEGQCATIKFMIECQVARGIRDGHFAPFITGGPADEETD